jgi:hypothetical protein
MQINKDELKERQCRKCDYLNNNIAIPKKKPNCIGMESQMNCKAFVETITFKNRINNLKGEFAEYYCKIPRKYGG